MKNNRLARQRLRRAIPRRLGVLVASALMVQGYGAAAHPAVATDLRRTPITFERNDGQFAADVLFAARGVAGDVTLGRGEISVLGGRGKRTLKDFGTPLAVPKPIRIGLAGSNRAAMPHPQDPRATRSHYYIGSDRRRYRENVPHYGQVVVQEIYPGIDLALHGTQGALEYDFIVAPHADTAAIRLDLSSADRVWLDELGNLQMRVGGEQLTQRAPVAYQDVDGERVRVPARFQLALSSTGIQATFAVAPYDRSRALVIDPIIAFSTYLGTAGDDGGGVMARDAQGRLHIAHTISEPSPGGTVRVTMIDPLTREVAYTTTFGGSATSGVRAIALRPGAGGVDTIVGGTTTSTDFPRCLAVADCVNHQGADDAFVTVLNAQGQLRFSRLLGGTGSDEVEGLAVDAAGNIHVVGTTRSANFPTTFDALFPAAPGGGVDAFVSKIDLGGTLAYSTFLGGSGLDLGTGIAVDDAGNIHVSGYSLSTNFPRTTPGTGISGPFVAKLNPAASAFLYSTQLGASGDWVDSIAIDPPTQGLVAGGTVTGFFSGIAGTRSRQDSDVFVARLSATAGLGQVHLLGGSGSDTLGGIAVAANGDIYVAGTTTAASVFPRVAPLPGAAGAGRSAFVARIRQGSIDFSTTLGGSGDDYGHAVAVEPSGDAYVLGSTMAADFPLVQPLQASLQGTGDVFLTRIVWADGAADTDGDGVPTGVEYQEGLNPFIKDNDVFTRNRLFVMQLYRDFLGREADEIGLQAWANQLTSGLMSRASVVGAFFDSQEFQAGLPQVTRLYFAFYNRIPDYPGLQFHAFRYRVGVPLNTIAQDFAGSEEFLIRYGSLTDAQ